MPAPPRPPDFSLWHDADISGLSSNVRFWPLADIRYCIAHIQVPASKRWLRFANHKRNSLAPHAIELGDSNRQIAAIDNLESRRKQARSTSAAAANKLSQDTAPEQKV